MLLTVVTPRTYIGWHRSGFQLFPSRFYASDGAAHPRWLMSENRGGFELSVPVSKLAFQAAFAT
jgi:hypothetical protein